MEQTPFIAMVTTLGVLGSACNEVQPPVVYYLTAPSASASAATPSATATATTPPPAPTPAPTPVPTPPEQLPSLFANPARSAPAAPIAGGTLLVTADGKTAVAVDPDRDRVFLVDLATHAVRSVATAPGEGLGRVVEGPAGTVLVAGRRGGAVLSVDVAQGTIAARFPVCSAPRGLAYDAATQELHVACRSGQLVTLDAVSGAVTRTVALDDDLRDVVLVSSGAVVTRFRKAELLRLDSMGAVTTRATPPNVGGSSAGVAFRTIAAPNGMVLLVHQVASNSVLGTGSGAYYGGGCSAGGAVDPVVSLVSLDGIPLAADTTSKATTPSDAASPWPIRSTLIGGALGPLDIAVSRDGQRLAVVASGNSWQISNELPNLYVDESGLAAGAPPPSFAGGSCSTSPNFVHHVPGEPVAVAFDANGRYVVQSREPAMLELEGDVFVPLSVESHFDTGFAMFHMNASGGVSCASCHPEGGDDGHTWLFSNLGLRRSQALEGGVGSRAPFHWSGDLTTFDDLFGEVMLKRMSLPVTPPSEDVAALAAWIDTIPALAPADGLDAALVERGRTLFADVKIGCAGCHSGASFSDNLKHDVGTGGEFVTPALLGVGLRAPLMHDGCAAALADRFGVCGGDDHGNVDGLPAKDIDALVAFMRSL